LELRERAVRLALESGRTIRQVARDLGIHHEALRAGVRQAEADNGGRRDLLTADVGQAESRAAAASRRPVQDADGSPRGRAALHSRWDRRGASRARPNKGAGFR
jgi:transposase